MNLQKYLSSLFVSGISIAIAIYTWFVPSTVARSLSMDRAEITAMVERQAMAWESQDARAIANDFASDAVFIAAGLRFEGQPQIQQAARDYFQQFHRTSVKIKRIVIDGNEGAVEWHWRDRERNTNREGFAEDAIVFELKNGKIVYWREYIENQS